MKNCPKCYGNGVVDNTSCDHCGGTGYSHTEVRSFKLKKRFVEKAAMNKISNRWVLQCYKRYEK